jgi:hypothetical protein
VWTNLGLENSPTARSGSQIWAYEGRMFMWGGSADDDYLYEVKGSAWEIIPTNGTRPAARQLFPAVVNETSFVIYPGHSPNMDQIVNDCFSLDLDTFQWDKISCIEVNKVYYAYTTFGSYLVLFGGLNTTAEANELILTYTTTEVMTMVLSPNVQSPSPRFGHTLMRCRDYLWLFGGEDQGE